MVAVERWALSEPEHAVNQEKDQEELNLEDANQEQNQRIEHVTDPKTGMKHVLTYHHFWLFDLIFNYFALDAVWQCRFAEQNRDRDENHPMIATREMIVIFPLIEKREEEIDLKIGRSEDVIEGEPSGFQI